MQNQSEKNTSEKKLQKHLIPKSKPKVKRKRKSIDVK